MPKAPGIANDLGRYSITKSCTHLYACTVTCPGLLSHAFLIHGSINLRRDTAGRRLLLCFFVIRTRLHVHSKTLQVLSFRRNTRVLRPSKGKLFVRPWETRATSHWLRLCDDKVFLVVHQYHSRILRILEVVARETSRRLFKILVRDRH
jgi:hypothetical protein